MAFGNLETTIQSSLATLSQRERRMLAGAAIAVAAFTVFMVTFSFNNSAERIRNRTAANIRQLDEIEELAANFNQARATQDAAQRQLAASNVRLMSYIEERANQKGIELPSINPKADVPVGDKIVESSVELTLTDQKLNRLVEFLQALEAGPGIVKVKYLRLEPRVQNETITAWLTVATYHVKN